MIQSFLYQNLIDINLCFYMILGSNIGTSITAIIAGLSLDRDSKYCSYINLVFNVIGVLIMVILMYYFPIMEVFKVYKTNLPLCIANFNLFSNIINVVGVVPIILIIKKRH